MRVQLRVRTVITLADWPRRQMIEGGAGEVGADHALPPSTLMGEGEAFHLCDGPLHRAHVRLN
jgi:hypothetical protein